MDKNICGENAIVVLVDLDGVLCDLEASTVGRFRRAHPDEIYINPEDREGMLPHLQYEKLKPGLGKKFNLASLQEGLFRDAAPIGGAIEKVKALQKVENVDVFLCSSLPLDTGDIKPEVEFSFAAEKLQWVGQHLGMSWCKKLILTSDKTIVNGDILVDDNAEIHGAKANPSWIHVLFSAPHNRKASPSGKGWRMESWEELDKLVSFINTLKKERIIGVDN